MTNPKHDDVSMDDRLPAEVELRGIGLSFTLGAGKNLSRTWDRELRTESESRFRSAVTREALEITFRPPILIDAQWPAMNMQLGEIKREFATGETKVYLGSIHGVAEGLIDFSDSAKKEIGALINGAVSGTAMERRGYNPMQDPHIVGTLETLADHFRRQPSSGVSDIQFSDFGAPQIEVNLAMKTDFRHIEKNAGLMVRQGTKIDMLISGRGNLANMVASRTFAERAAATNVDTVTISSDGLLVVVNDKPVAYLDRMRIDRGGAVTLEKMRLEGVVGQAEGMESVIRMVAAAMKWVTSGASNDTAMRMGTNSGDVLASFVPDAVRDQIEKTLTQGVKQILLANRNVVPELDLVEIMGT